MHGLISRIDDHNLADFIDNTSLKPFQPMEVESSLTQNLEQISNTMIQDSETKD
ncbi:MAG: hypothetical protein HWD61_02670 [Parachlamydiaceae bacterium]|nr:MAG: hypothetical protein HWD61_02670 [Parachlamydiaceae bacterium]